MKAADWVALTGIIAIGLIPVLFGACEDSATREARIAQERETAFVLACIKKRGSPVVENGEFRTCDYTRHYGFKKE